MKATVKFVMWVLLGAAVVHGCLSAVASCAHADTGQPGQPALPIEAWIALAIAAGGGLVMMLRGAAELFGVIARRTATKKDDAVYERLDGFVDTLEEVLGLLRGVKSGTVVNVAVPAEPPRDPQSGFSVTGFMATLALAAVLASAGYLTLSGCATVERGTGAAKVAVLECGKANLAGSAALVARWGVEDALAGEVQWAKHETDALGFGLGVATCAYAEVRRAWKEHPTPQARSLVSQPSDDGTAGLERLRAQLGGAQIVLADGTVM